MSFWHQKEKQRIVPMEKSAPNDKATVVALGICAVCLGLLFLGTGCPGPTGCQTDADCAGDLICNVETGQCEEPPPGCTSDADCPEGEVCNLDTGECEAAPVGCTSDDDCPEGEVCNLDTGECEAAPVGCTSDDDCPEGEMCNLDTGECEAAPVGCTSDDDCPEGEVCNLDTGECEAAPAGCTSDEDCAEGEFCEVTTGECIANVNLYEVTRVDADYPERVHFEPAGHMDCTVCHHAADADAGIPNAAGMSCLACHPDDPNEPNSFKNVAHDENGSGDGCRMCHAAEFENNCKFCHPELPD
jgi:Cys-rich repeat protein